MEPTSDDLVALTRQIWESLLCRELDVDLPDPGRTVLGPTSCVHISGGWNGSVLVTFSAQLARTVAETMFGMDPGEASPEDIADAIGEIANMIGGNVKSLVPGPSQLSLPTVADADDLRSPRSEECAHSSFVTADGPMLVTVLRRVVDAEHQLVGGTR